MVGTRFSTVIRRGAARLAALFATLVLALGMVVATPSAAYAADSDLSLGLPTWSDDGSTYTLKDLKVSTGVSGIRTVVVSVSSGSMSIPNSTADTVVTDLNGQTATLIYSSAKSASDIQTALQGITFTGSAGQTVTVKLSTQETSSSITTSNKISSLTDSNGLTHYYMYVASDNITWDNAKSGAEGYTYMGMKGYLATITSSTENSTLTAISNTSAWAGAKVDNPENYETTTDRSNAYTWRVGPEKGKTFAQTGYAPWYTGEPNASLIDSVYECCLEVNYKNSTWNDLVPTQGGSDHISGYFVEFGGFSDSSQSSDGYSADSAYAPVATQSLTITDCTVSTDTTDRISVSPTTKTLGKELEATVTPVNGWDVPTANQMTVTMGGTTLTSGTDYTYTAGTSAGTLTITKVTGAVVISATNMPTWYTANDGANKTALEEVLAATDASTLDATALDNLISGWESIANTSGAQDAIADALDTTVDAINQKLKNLNAANDFDTTHGAVKDITSLDPNSDSYATDKKAIEAAKDDYDNLSDEQKALLPSDYADAFAALDWTEGAKDLYEKSPVTKDDLADLQKLVDSYDELSDDQKALVKDVYDDIANKLAGAKVLDDNDAIISDAGPVDASDVDAIDKALEDYNNLTEDQQKAIDPDGTIKADLEAKKAAADWAKEYEDILNKDASELTADDIAKLNEAKAAYDALSPAAQAMVSDDVISDLLSKQSDLFIKTYVSDSAGNIYTSVTADNYEQILSGQDDWNKLTQDEKDAINDKLVEATGMTYEQMIAKAETLQASANSFIEKYLTGSDGSIFKEATRDNYAQILSGLDAWNALSQDEKDAINAILVANGGKTYEELVAQAKKIKAQVEAKKLAKTGDVAPTALVVLAGAGAAATAAGVLIRRREQR